MISVNGSYSLADFLAARQLNFGVKKRYLFWFCVFTVVMAVLESGQDYISSILNDHYFQPVESLSYKFFWFLFIPLSILQLYLLEKTGKNFSGIANIIGNTLFIPVVTLIHLMIFSLFLFGISGLIHENPWSLSFLVAEKLSTRLYIGLAIYIAFPAVYILLNNVMSAKEPNRQTYSSTIPVKNGRHTTPVDVDNIQWICSDGAYLYIFTEDKKHVVMDSLKHIITTLPDNFRRIHRSTIVNIDFIRKLKSRGNGDYDVILDDERQLRLSRNYTSPLKGTLL